MGATPTNKMPHPHAVFVPFPAQGHITPMMKLAKIFHCKGFHVTFVNTEYNHRRLVRSRGPDAVVGLPDFHFATIPDGLPPSDADATQDIPSLCYSTMTNCLPHLKNLLRDLNGAAGVPQVTCVMADAVMSFCLDAAAELSVPCALFWTASACGFMGYHNFRFLLDEGLAPLKDEEQVKNGYLDTQVTQARGMSKHMRLRDFPTFFRTTDRGDVMFNFLMHEVEQSSRAAAVILNTFGELEQTALDAMCAILSLPVYTIGPLNFLAEQVVPDDGAQLAMIRPSLWREDHSCLEWLRGREPRSVVYVNFGSITTMSIQELVEFAWGLANCGYDFLWIVRNDLVKGDAAVVPPEFLEATEGRCLLASWCEQEAVLRHEAVGTFLTHCGWNSTMEAARNGVPVLCWPYFCEQFLDRSYVTDVWRTGLAVSPGEDGIVSKEEVRSKVEGVIGDAGIRKRASWLKDTASRCIGEGGSSQRNFKKFIDLLSQ